MVMTRGMGDDGGMKTLLLLLTLVTSGCAGPQFATQEEADAYNRRWNAVGQGMTNLSNQLRQQNQSSTTNCVSSPNVFGGYNTTCN